MKRFFYTILSILTILGPLKAQDIPDPMSPPRLVNDFAGVLNREETLVLEQKLRAYHDSTSTQIYVVTVPTLNGYDPADYAFQLGEKWGVGQKGKNNGIVILIKPKIGNERGQAFVATGYGMEEVIPDAVARRIVDNEMIPYFKQNRYYKGINAAVDVIIDLASGLYSADEYYKGDSPIPGIIFLILFFGFIFLSGRRGARVRGGTFASNLPFWLLLGSMGGGRGSSFSDFSSGSGSFGGFSGGGGGSFGGGGAGGSW
ncbi:TPM domain-containing protein [Tenuifilum thalassicum]|uniref:TPM domain-containing protein n=1 Tax=Tenuifilum thalassicum TaxID=2590900 RepID=A0A7D4BDN7_9BACT|nr:TPM domain-containing protein [Tenuifilum thalassicum]QKG79478.1 TPM domain-containing protein [Tenuifilum thalassicum]